MPPEDSDGVSFPQRATTQIPAPNPTTEQTQRQAGPNFFRDGENVKFVRAEALTSHRVRSEDHVLCIETSAVCKVNRTAQTHDSVMHQFIDVPESPGKLWFEVSFFTQDIFRVKFAGHDDALSNLTDNPIFPFAAARMLVGKRHQVPVKVIDEDKFIHFSSESTEIRVQKEPFRLAAFRKGQKFPFWKQRLSDLFTSDAIPTSIAQHQGRTAAFEAFVLDPNEALFGLGERFDSVERIGRPVDFVNHDAIGCSNTRGYINVPFFWSTSGYGCFVNSYARTEWDMGMSERGTVGFCTEEEHMDYFIISAETPKDILKRYTNDLTGISPLPPIWTFGLWLSRNSYQSWSVVDDILAKCEKHKIPVDDIHLDTAWFKEDWNPDLIFDKVRFANHEEKMARLKKQGIHVSLWQYTFAPPRDDNSLFQEGLQNGYFGCKRLPDGSTSTELFSYPPDSSGWRLDDAVIDFSNPAVREWYGDKITSLIRQGASAIKTDFGDCIPPDAVYHSIEGRRFQNLYSLAYNATIAAALKSAKPESDETPAIWARSGTAGSQRYPVHWGGDSQCSWAGLQGSFRATLSIGLSGFAFFSHDIGGFIGKPDPELYIRWAQVGLLAASHSRTHGAGDENSREPWCFGEEEESKATGVLSIFRKFVDLKYRLLPYIVEQSRTGAKMGWPLIRHLMLEYPEDRNLWHIETQYLLGEGIMVAPVLMPAEQMGSTMPVYFPAGVWFDFWSKQVFLRSHGQWVDVDVPGLDGMAIWVREGTMLCYAEAGRQRTWNSVGKVVEIELYGNSQRGATSDIWRCGTGAGADMLVEKDEGGELVCKADPVAMVKHYAC